MLEAKLIGLKEGLKIAVVWLVFYAYLVKRDGRSLMGYAGAGIAVSLILSVLILLLPQVEIDRNILANIVATSLALFFIFSAAAMLHASGTNLFRPLRDSGIPGQEAPVSALNPFFKGWAGGLTVFFIAMLFFIPDHLGSLLFLNEVAYMRDVEVMTYVYAFMGFIFPLVIMFLVIRLYKPYWIGNYFDFPQFLLFLAIVKLLGSGVKGFAELSLIPSVQRGFMKFVHDFIHQTLVLFMIPDHPLLKTTVWDFIGIFFGADLASYASLLILLVFPLMFIYYSMFRPLPEPDVEKNVEKRKIKAFILGDRRKKALPVFLFIGLVLVGWFVKRGDITAQIYEPEPRPVVVEGGKVFIPLKDPSIDLTNGMLHKFSLVHEGEEIRIMVMKKPGKNLFVGLDACEICPPDGYGQREDHVVCLYCSTPIPVDTLGKPGGCNPIPLGAWLDSENITISLKEVAGKWGFVKAGRGGELIRQENE